MEGGEAREAARSAAPEPGPEPEPGPRAEGERRFPCKRCGAQLAFKPGTYELNCAHCGAHNEIELDESAIEEMDFEAYLALLEEGEAHEDKIVSRCDSCGARVELPTNVTSGPCPFCSKTVVATGRSEKLVRPASLLPFAFGRNEARERFRAWLGKLWFAPGDLKKAATIDGKLSGVYLPFWTYDSGAITDYTGMRGEYYYVTQTYTTMVNGKPQVRTRQVRKTRWWPASGRVRNFFDDLLVPASHSLPAGDVRKLEPWDLGELKPYADEFLAGFGAESYAVNLPSGFEVAKELMAPEINATIRRDIGGDEQRITTSSSTYHSVTFKHILLPVWVCAYRYKDRAFRILVNARTGEVIGDRPWSVAKISFLVAVLITLVVAAVAIFLLFFRN